jgi:hypothetical protein
VYISVSIPSIVINQLGFEQMKKRLGYRIIPTIGLSTHTLYIAVALEDLAKTGASILDASIRMDCGLNSEVHV